MKSISILLVLMQALLHRVSTQNHQQRDKWYQASHSLDSVIWPLKNRFIDLINRVSTWEYISTCSSECRKSLIDLKDGLMRGKREAHLLFDSMSKSHSGFLTDRPFDHGAYYQCLRSQFNNQSARYALVQVKMPLPYDSKEIRYTDEHDSWISQFSNYMSMMRGAPVTIALCLPADCSEQDIRTIVESDFIRKITDPIEFLLLSTESLDDEIVPKRLWLRTISRIILWSITITVFTSTLVNYLNPELKFLQAFDAVANTRKLAAETREENRSLAFFNGIRALYLIFNIPSHVGIPHVESTLLYNFAIVRNMDQHSQFIKSYALTAPHYVSSNVVMASCLSTIGWLPQIEKSKRGISFIGFLILRALRTLPVVVGLMLIIFTFPIISTGGGPLMKPMQERLNDKCFEHGWKDLLFISNWGTFHEMCLPVGWFMSADFQLYAISFIYLIYMKSRPKIALMLIAAQIVAGIVLHAKYLSDVDVGSIVPLWNTDAYGNLHGYIKLFAHTYNYVAIYPVGVLLGLLIDRRYRLPNVTVKNRLVTFAFLAVLMNIVLFSPVLLYNENYQFKLWGRTGEIIFGSIHRVLFVVFYSAACLLLQNHPDMWFTRFLSSGPLMIISRFSYSAFLAHPLVIMFLLTSLPDFYVTDSLMLMMYPFVIIVSLFAGFVLFLLIEAPAMNLLKGLAVGKKAINNEPVKKQETNNNQIRNGNHHFHAQ